MTTTKPFTRSLSLIVSLSLLAATFTGCQSTNQTMGPGKVIMPDVNKDPLVVNTAGDLDRNTEVQLVEQMAAYRARYKQYLDLMVQFYDRQGNQLKHDWAIQELANLSNGPERAYLVVAELAGPDLKASNMHDSADQLYEQGIAQMKNGAGTIGKLFYNKKELYGAINTFNQLISDYPDSDKIDDAAFQIAEIYNHYLKDYTTALMYYQRVWQWDPQTTLPVRFWVARIYDEQFKDRVKALEYYEMAINMESSYPVNLVWAQNRVARITRDMK